MSRDRYLSVGLLVAGGAWVAAVVWAVAGVLLGASGLIWLALTFGSGGVLFALLTRRLLIRAIGLVAMAVSLVVLSLVVTGWVGWLAAPAVLLELAAAALSLLAVRAAPDPKRQGAIEEPDDDPTTVIPRRAAL